MRGGRIAFLGAILPRGVRCARVAEVAGEAPADGAWGAGAADKATRWREVVRGDRGRWRRKE